MPELYSVDEQYGLWSAYGLRGNPFSPDALPTFGGEMDIEGSFYGRQKETEQVNAIIYNNNQSRILINGDIGLGKTTFANYVRYLAFKKGYFTTIAEIGIQHDWDAENFMEVTLTAIYTSINRIKGVRDKFDKAFLEKLDIYFGTSRGYSSGKSATLGPVGLGGEKGATYDVPPFNSFIMKDLLSEIVENLKKARFKGLIIHYNNLELLHDKEERTIIRLFNGIRDFLQTEGVHFIFVGDSTVPDILQKVPRVDDIFYGPPIHMPPFTLTDICQILGRRVENMRIGSNITYERPYSDEAIDILYRLFEGNIRAIFKSLTTALTAIVSENKPIILRPRNMAITLRRIAEERYLSKLNKTEQKILIQIMSRKETTNKLISEALKLMPQNVSNAITKLRSINAIRLSRVEGRARYYVPSPEIKWLLFKVSSDGQATLADFQ